MAANAEGIAGKRLDKAQYARNFADLHPPLTDHEALVEADRCYFCYDAPCMTACPTSIDIPMFIRQISTGNPKGAAKTIFDQNILGGMCARVCPTETLCEEACVREAAEGKPVKIGLLQRYATDALMAGEDQPFSRAKATGKNVAVVGAGPAGLACAHRLAMHGHDVTIFEARKKAGGLNEYGIAAYKTVDGFAAREVDFVLSIGGITVKTGKALGRASSSRNCSATSTRCSSAWACRRQCAGRQARGCRRRRGRGRLHRRAAPGEGSGQTAGRPPRGGDRRRHDRHRRCRAVEAARRRGRDHRLPPRAPST